MPSIIGLPGSHRPQTFDSTVNNGRCSWASLLLLQWWDMWPVGGQVSWSWCCKSPEERGDDRRHHVSNRPTGRTHTLCPTHLMTSHYVFQVWLTHLQLWEKKSRLHNQISWGGWFVTQGSTFNYSNVKTCSWIMGKLQSDWLRAKP